MIKIAFINWWSTGHDDFFKKFIENYLNIPVEIDINNPDILFFSVFYKLSPQDFVKSHPSVKIKIFFTGEDTTSNKSRGSGSDHYYLNYADIILGFKYIEHPNYIRFPLWLTYINIEKYNMGKKCLPFSKMRDFKPNSYNFCCIISNHDSNNTRTSIVNNLYNYKPVYCAGNIFKHSNNVNHIRVGCGKGEHNKQLLLNKYKFNICSESSITPGYITEKIFECLIAGCIPIYYSLENTPIESDIINNNFIIKYDNNNYQSAIQKIINLDSNPNNFQDFIKQNPLTNNAYQHIIEYYDKLKTKLLLFIKSNNIHND